ncbi:MAG: AAA family ATPase, partial [Spirochaetales bacterium]|nr:AAA family ATPase [Spirochaetales bacterium]
PSLSPLLTEAEQSLYEDAGNALTNWVDEDLVALFEAEGFTVASRNLTLVEQRRMSAPEVAHYLKRSYLPALAKKGTSVDEQAMLSQAKEALSERPLPWRVHLLFLEARLS